ncbi:hypothetical protein Droror1_Dr00008566 [Drosera rotundifolia]
MDLIVRGGPLPLYKMGNIWMSYPIYCSNQTVRIPRDSDTTIYVIDEWTNTFIVFSLLASDNEVKLFPDNEPSQLVEKVYKLSIFDDEVEVITRSGRHTKITQLGIDSAQLDNKNTVKADKHPIEIETTEQAILNWLKATNAMVSVWDLLMIS